MGQSQSHGGDSENATRQQHRGSRDDCEDHSNNHNNADGGSTTDEQLFPVSPESSGSSSYRRRTGVLGFSSRQSSMDADSSDGGGGGNMNTSNHSLNDVGHGGGSNRGTGTGLRGRFRNSFRRRRSARRSGTASTSTTAAAAVVAATDDDDGLLASGNHSMASFRGTVEATPLEDNDDAVETDTNAAVAAAEASIQSPEEPFEINTSFQSLGDIAAAVSVEGDQGLQYPSSPVAVHDQDDNGDTVTMAGVQSGRLLSNMYAAAGLTNHQTGTTRPFDRNRRSSGDSYQSTTSIISSVVSDDDSFRDQFFYPPVSRDNEWMGRSIENLLLGHEANAPILQLLDQQHPTINAEFDELQLRRRSTASTFGGGGGGGGGYSRRRSSAGSFPGGRRGSLSLSTNGMQGGTMAMYNNNRHSGRRMSAVVPTDVDRSDPRPGRRGSAHNGPMYRRRSSMASTSQYDHHHNHGPSLGQPSTFSSGTSVGGGQQQPSSSRKSGGPNIVLNVMARESTGRTCFQRNTSESQRLRRMGGAALYAKLDIPAAGIATEVRFLQTAIDSGDWTETHAIVSRLVVRLVGDPSSAHPGAANTGTRLDPNLPPTAHAYYAGGGRLGLERDAFCLAGGVPALIRIFREKSFVGQEMSRSYDARDLSESIVATRLSSCWNEVLASLRELVYYMPSLVANGIIQDDGDFLPFLFTLLSHESCFDAAAALIEEMLSFMSQTQPSPPQEPSSEPASTLTVTEPVQPAPRAAPACTFFLGNVPDLYKLWRGFNCRQLAHFCRILALLVFEPEDRQLLESPAVLKSLELLQLRRNRAARAGRDSTVDMNQSILLGDEELVGRLLKLLRVMNYAPPLDRYTPSHVLANFPFVADTLVMLGLGELESWDEIDRQDALARQLLERSSTENNSTNTNLSLNELGSVANMLDDLSEALTGNNRPPNQIGHIITVISAAQQADIIVGRNRSSRERRNRNEEASAASQEEIDIAAENPLGLPTTQGIASVAGILTDQLLVRRLYQNAGQSSETNENGEEEQMEIHENEARHLISSPEDSANSLQFNAMLLGPYQVEVLFVLCTLLGGRRKLDAQNVFRRLGVVPILDDMFERLPWSKKKEESRNPNDSNSEENEAEAPQRPNGIHGPGCECTPESALCVQYLRMLHNFCDRDCDNYDGRHLLLSDEERQYILKGDEMTQGSLKRGLLSKLAVAFIDESDESPYRFWLASCIESYLRGSSPREQLFVAKSGLMDHLIDEVSGDKLHCAGSLQTSFDLLGELGKGNATVVRMLVSKLDEESFRKLMSVAAANLVDSNVFIRSLLLTLERFSAMNGTTALHLRQEDDPDATLGRWLSPTGNSARAYLSHSWWDACTIKLTPGQQDAESSLSDQSRPSDWFPPREIAMSRISDMPLTLPPASHNNTCQYGYVFTPTDDSLPRSTLLPNTVERLSWFLAANQARLLRELLGVVDLRNINHENICCLNTAVVIAIFAHRRKELSLLLNELRQMNDDEKESQRRALHAGQAQSGDVVDRAFVQAMKYVDISQRERPPYARRASLTVGTVKTSADHQLGDRSDVMRNFREVLWFWLEYYTHRGRDRLSLEFSSHIRFQEWKHVVSLLVADDGSATSLVRSPVRLPRSPYQRAARVSEFSFVRGN